MLSTKTALEEKIRVSNERDEEYKLGKKGPESQDEKAGVAFLIYNYITQDKNLSKEAQRIFVYWEKEQEDKAIMNIFCTLQ